jgi:hypothetical protein
VAPKKPPRRPRSFGLRPRDYPRNVRYKFDADYLDKLTPEERKWYAKFMEGHLGGDSVAMADWPQATRRAAYNDKNAVNRDLYSISESVGLLQIPDAPIDVGESGPTRDWNATPDYQNDPGYMALKVHLREAIDSKADKQTIANLRRRLEIYNG